MTRWLTTIQLAQHAGIGRQSAHEVISSTLQREDYLWRGSRLIVAQRHGRGGRSGRAFQVRVDSLPIELQLRIETPQSPVEISFNPPAKAAETAAWWAQFLQPILAHPKGSRERRAALTARAEVRTCGPRGVWFTPSLRDIERKVGKATAGGLKALMRKRRETKPESRLILTKRWDAATIGLDDGMRAEIARKARQRKVSVGGELFYCDELVRHTGSTVRVQLPKYLHWPAIPVLTTAGAPIGIAYPDPVYSRLDPIGAEEAARRKGVARAAIAAEAADLTPIDVKAEMIASGQRQPLPPVPASKGTIELADGMAETGRRLNLPMVEALAGRMIAQIDRYLLLGCSVRDIARTVGASERTVWRRRARLVHTGRLTRTTKDEHALRSRSRRLCRTVDPNDEAVIKGQEARK